MDKIKLSNGTEENKTFYQGVVKTLDTLSPIALVELIELCNHDDYVIVNSNKELEEKGLIKNGVVPSAIKNIVLCTTDIIY